MKTPELKTARLLLIPYSDWLVTEEHVAWLKDPEVVKYSEQRHVGHSLVTQKLYVGWAALKGAIWLIRKDGVDIGSIGIQVETNNKRADMGILIGNRAYHGQGLATEAWKAVMDWGFNELGLRKIECGCMSPNLGMRQVAIKSGMVIEGGRVGHFLLDGKPVDVVYYGKMRP